MLPERLKNEKSAVVVAGSDGDIGRSIVRLFSEKGVAPIGLSRTGKHRQGLSEAFCLDLSDAAAVEAAVQKIASDGRKIRLVINAAGYYRKTTESAREEDVLKNNLGVTDNILRAFTPRMLGVDRARIITIGSIDHKYPNINSFSYSLAKASIKTLVELYRKRYRNSLANFDLISPGAVNTRMRADKDENKAALVQPEDVARICHMLYESGSNAAFDEIVVYPKSFAYSI